MANQQFNENENTMYQIDSNDFAIINKKTGQLVVDSPDLNAILKTAYGQKAFWKLYMADYIQVILGTMDFKQLDVFMYISMNTQPSTNLFIGTYETIARDSGVSRDTAIRLVKKLIANDFMKRKQNGVYMVNPSIVMKGNNTKKSLLLTYYDTEQMNQPLPKKKNKVLDKQKDREPEVEGQLTVNDDGVLMDAI